MAFENFDIEFAGPATYAAMYRAQGWQVVPAHDPTEGGEWKRPFGEWLDYRNELVPDFTFARWYDPQAGQHRNRQNMGFITGAASGGLVVIDLDRKAGSKAFDWWAGLLAVHANNIEPETPSQITGGGGRQLVFRAPAGWIPPTFKAPAMCIDIRGQGGFAMCPPSRHASGREYVWEEGREPWTVEVMELPPWAVEAIDKLRLEYARNAGQGTEHAPHVGQERDAWGRIVDGREERMTVIVWGVACDLRRTLGDTDPAGHPTVEAERERAWGLYLYDIKTRLGDAKTNEEGLEREGRGRSAFDEKWSRALAQWNGKLAWEASVAKPPPKPAEAGGAWFDPWTRFKVPAFPTDLLPPSQREYIEHQTANLGADASGIAMAMLTAMSGSLDQRFRLRLRRHGQFLAPPRLWTVLVGDPATKKSPIIGEVTWPIRKIENEFAAKRARDFAVWEAAAKDDKGDKPPPSTRFILNDVTVEAAAMLLAQQDRGVLVVHDELSSFIGSLDRYSSGASDRAFWLMAHGGGSLSVDRVTRNLFISNLCVAFLAAVQPDRMAQLTDLMADGLLQRFLPVLIERGPKLPEVETDLPAVRYADRISFLANMKPQTLQMTSEGYDVAREFRDMAEGIEGDAETVGRAYASWGGKLAAVFGSLSLLLHILEKRDEAPYAEVGEATVQRAARIVTEFIIPHGRAFYDEVFELRQREDLQKVASFLLTSDAERFTRSDLRYNVRALGDAGTAWEFDRLLSPFVGGGWLEEDGKGWNLTSGVRDQFAARRASELERKAKVLARFKQGAAHAPV